MQAQQVTLSEAKIVGKNAVSDSRVSVQTTYTFTSQSNRSNVLLYEVVMDDGQAVLLSGNKMCMPVLGFFRSTGASILDTLSTEVPPGLISLIKGYAEQVQRSFDEDFEENEHNATWQNLITQRGTTPYVVIVPPLLKSKWDQTSSIDGICNAYNHYVTSNKIYCKDTCFTSYSELASSLKGSSTNRCPPGCTAVAMAQVMYYWKYPMQYDWCNMEDSLAVMSNINCDQVPFQNPDGNWQWKKICDPNPNYEKQRNAVAKLIYDAAESEIWSDYCFGATCQTTAAPFRIGIALRNDFGYHSDANFHWKSCCSNGTWTYYLTTNLKAGRPVIYGSLGTNADAHCFVCDGYGSNYSPNGFVEYFHFNWGWGGLYNDSWWALDYIRPGGSHYDISEYAVFDIYPSTNFDFCNFNYTLPIPLQLQLLPIYPTNLTVNFTTNNNTITSGQNVTYKAHKSIIIKPGFRAAAGSNFRAHIEPCAKCPQGSPSPAPQNPNVYLENEDEHSNNIPNLSSSISVFPNPTTGIVNIIAENTKIENISVFDISGKVLENNTSFAGTTLDLSWLSNGIYFIKIKTLSEQTTHKVIIQK